MSEYGEPIKGLEVDTFFEFVLLNDDDVLTRLTVDEALTLANRLTRAANKAAQYAE